MTLHRIPRQNGIVRQAWAASTKARSARARSWNARAENSTTSADGGAARVRAAVVLGALLAIDIALLAAGVNLFRKKALS